MSGTWLVTGLEPVFKVADTTQSAEWYERAGFRVSFHDDTYAFAHRDRDITIHLTQVSGDELPGHGGLYLHCQDGTARPRTGDGRRSPWTGRGTRTMASERALSSIPTAT
jgi:hypothetical protein